MTKKFNQYKMQEVEQQKVNAGSGVFVTVKVLVCGCGCRYENSGGSSTANNGAANSAS